MKEGVSKQGTKGGNVQLGPYAKVRSAGYAQANGMHGTVKAFTGSHRKTTAVPRFKGKGAMHGKSKAGGKTFGG